MPAGLTREVRLGLAGLVAGRIGVNGGIRVAYPFLPVIADGLGMSLGAIAALVAARSLAGLAGPALAGMVAPHRRRSMLLGGLLLVVAGCLLIVAAPGLPDSVRAPLIVIGFATTGLARPLFDLPMQTWVSVHVPATQRGRAVGVTELGWAMSLAATVPLAAALVGPLGWRSPFLIAAAVAVLGMLAVWATIGPERAVARPAPAGSAAPVSRRAVRRTVRVPTAAAICLTAGLTVAAAEQLLVVYGAWLETDFGLSAAEIGASTLLIVAAELLGEGLAAALADRVGLCRALFGALIGCAVTYALFGFIGGDVLLAVVAIAVWFVAFEVAVVVLIAFACTVGAADRASRPPAGRYSGAAARARLLGALMAAIAVGNAAGALLAPVTFEFGGIAAAGATSAALTMAATAVLWLGSRPVRA